jgi:hypothetical protein
VIRRKFLEIDKSEPMTFVESSHFTDPDAAARKLVEIANASAARSSHRSSFVPFPVVLRPTAGLVELGSL